MLNLNKKFFPPLAQLVEQIPLKDKVVGSIPTGRTQKKLTNSLSYNYWHMLYVLV